MTPCHTPPLPGFDDELARLRAENERLKAERGCVLCPDQDDTRGAALQLPAPIYVNGDAAETLRLQEALRQAEAVNERLRGALLQCADDVPDSAEIARRALAAPPVPAAQTRLQAARAIDCPSCSAKAGEWCKGLKPGSTAICIARSFAVASTAAPAADPAPTDATPICLGCDQPVGDCNEDPNTGDCPGRLARTTPAPPAVLCGGDVGGAACNRLPHGDAFHVHDGGGTESAERIAAAHLARYAPPPAVPPCKCDLPRWGDSADIPDVCASFEPRPDDALLCKHCEHTDPCHASVQALRRRSGGSAVSGSDVYVAVRAEVEALERERLELAERCEHPTETVLELGGGRRRYTCDSCSRERDLGPPAWLASSSRSPAPGDGR